jgi:hypothetical protein
MAKWTRTRVCVSLEHKRGVGVLVLYYSVLYSTTEYNVTLGVPTLWGTNDVVYR